MIDKAFVTINGLRTSQAILGDASQPPIVMLHGWGANIDLMLPLAQRLPDFRIYIPDLPGFGSTQQPPTAWGVIDYAQFVIAYLDHHQLDRVHLFAHSNGGRISLFLGAEYPQRLQKMILADSAGVRPKPSTSGQTRLKTYKFAQNALRSVGLGAQADQLREWYTERYGSADYKAARGVMRETLVKLVNSDLVPYAERVQASTLLLWGDQDEDTPLWHGETLEKAIPDAGLVVLKGAGHFSYLDQLAATVRIVNHFLKAE